MAQGTRGFYASGIRILCQWNDGCLDAGVMDAGGGGGEGAVASGSEGAG